MLDLPEALGAVSGLIGIVRQFTRALGKASQGGRKITPDEWLEITTATTTWMQTTAKDFVD